MIGTTRLRHWEADTMAQSEATRARTLKNDSGRDFRRLAEQPSDLDAISDSARF
jgi:hypothetical protein